jgi:hypothetical protein
MEATEVELSEPYYLKFKFINAMRGLDEMIVKELGDLINQMKKEDGYSKIIVQTWDLAKVQWKQEILEQLFKTDKIEIKYE